MLSLVAFSLFGLSAAFPSLLSEPQLLPRATCSGNTADTRSEWCDYSIDTDYTSEAPDTGVTREYWFELTETTAAPDGVERYVQAINGSIPGPTIFADWGDTVVVHVTNAISSSTNGTSIHFHGIRQNYTNQEDGVSSITQCPTPPGSSITYTWRAVQYGSTWYHSHWALQAWEGVFGGIIINGPATSDYDEDLGMLFLNDWDHSTVDELYIDAESSGPPTLDTGLINGTNIWTDDDDNVTGYRFNVSLTEDSSYRLRLVNAAVDSHFKFMVDNHTLTVIATDLVPIEPFTTDIISIGMGQRYDVIITANQAAVADSFWIRAIPQSACSENDNADNIKGIVYYGSSTTTPTTSRTSSYVESCEDMDVSDLVPYISKTATSIQDTGSEGVTVGFNDEDLFRWYLNSTTMVLEWSDPTLLQIYDNTSTFDTSDAVIKLPNADEWVYMVIETTFSVPHPIHLHGHDYLVLAQGSGTYNSSTVTLNLDNPPRRDTAMLPGNGYLVIAFQTDNPGAWIMHCHIGWHTSEGFALQFIERESEISALIDYDTLSDNCDAWSTYQSSESVVQDDSGV
ncbi:hypothetical protein JX265_000944 [Neoarthrinium moseri]|uniref:laccase n=1 Tax=Neoarthrinium moseri TaxID=1658444 RepID=A0A9Q0AVZ7_9PEZI|nr:uncharacterized protein JN550_004782 [Neoarthrinium moseri]KAI1846020.1 hypothetical protein JX266_007829 [Neoarthrinium moseri]KAI1871337.1 hypothetical protein JN550_004782 [Neoarthrinium moseri]KAI1880704.1 hypothetical protein JX265_000944 [Neoarthrinium moseri]